MTGECFFALSGCIPGKPYGILILPERHPAPRRMRNLWKNSDRIMETFADIRLGAGIAGPLPRHGWKGRE